MNEYRSSEIPQQFRLAIEPQASPQAMVRCLHARFTLLTERLLRMEYSPEDRFEDRASQVFWYRRQAVPDYTREEHEGVLEIRTPYLCLRYLSGRAFASDSLSIEMLDSGRTWRFGDSNPRNLGGTLRTLDMTSGPVNLSEGLISRDGWALVDDSTSLIFNPEGWLEPRTSEPGRKDLYFFAYGHAYQDCMRDYLKVSGNVPLIPRWALGNWWSRYWAYTQDELTRLMLAFESHEIPLSVCIVDMDWHITRTGNESSGWTGYTWNRELFPDPDAFIAFLHDKGLKTALNLHPAEGIHAHEAAYHEMAKWEGMDPEQKLPVPFDLANPHFTEAYFRILHYPEEKRGVDFWWLDWQQGGFTQMPGLDPLWWLNHLHALDRARNADRRIFTFSRWGGLGNHRYPIGFSGDTFVTWESLAFQPYFTATAANVGYGWWSHDIGGHLGGIEDAELYTRWVQFGVFSPILRLHSTKNPYHERLPWNYDAETSRITQKAFKLRHSLIPYLYSMAWREHSRQISLVRPMYYEHPESESAYQCADQYLFGSELIAAPFTQPAEMDTRLARKPVWLPEGDWFDFFSGEYYPGNRWYVLYGGAEDIPVFARAGAIIPLDPQPNSNRRGNPDRIEIHLFPGKDNEFELYEDEGEGQGYLSGKYAMTRLALAWEPQRLLFTIPASEGHVDLLPAARKIELVFHSIHEPQQLSLTVNGTQQKATLLAEPEEHIFRLPGLIWRPGDRIDVQLERGSGNLMNDGDPLQNRLLRMIKAFRMPTQSKNGLALGLEQLIRDPDRLGLYRAALSDHQLQVLIEQITGAGFDRHRSSGREKLIFWNNLGFERVSYRLSVEHVLSYQPDQRFTEEHGALPRFRVIEPGQDLLLSNWRLDLDYLGLLHTSLEHQQYPV